MMKAEDGPVAHHYDGPERRSGRQSGFDRLLHTVWGVIGVLAVVASVAASVALSAQRFIGAPAANAKAITSILTTDSVLAVRLGSVEATVEALSTRADVMALQHIDINQQLRQLGIVICASLGDPNVREVRVACAALRSNGGS
jgi:hypothetical protein